MKITRRTLLKSILAAPAAILLPKLSLAESKIPAIRPDVNPGFYLEVSARRSGKTTRLIKDLTDYIERTGNDVYLVTPTEGMRSLLYNYIPKPIQHKVKHLPKDPKLVRPLKMYFDEPGLICEPWKQIISDNAYYTGTPQGKTFFDPKDNKRKDNFLWKLAKLKPDYKKYSPYSWETIDNKKQIEIEWKKDVPKYFDQEYLGKFV